MIYNHKGLWLIKGDECISKWVKETGKLAHDVWLMERLEKRIKRRDIALDIGAYIGDHTIKYAEWFNHVVAYEPNPEAFECLLRNTAKCGNVNCINAAVSNEDMRYNYVPVPNNPGAQAMVANPGGSVVSVKITDMPGQIDFIKIDVEGMEYDVLVSLDEIIKKHRPCMLIEQRMVDGNVELVEAFLRYQKYDFEPIQHTDGKPDKPMIQYDLWCTPQ